MMIRNRLRLVGVPCLMAALAAGSAGADDWPTYKKDPGRSAVTGESLAFPLAKKWTYRPNQPPEPAWPEPGKELHRMDFDYAFQPVVADGLIYFGSSADDTVRALNASNGELVWRFTANGPIRFAPTVARGRVCVTSDDGWLYCLDAKTGELLWRFRPTPEDDQILGNGRMISRWPCRSGAVVVDDVVYCTAGMWPTEGVYVYALDAGTGKQRWCNDSSGAIYIDLPHPVACGFSGVAPQGYLLVHEDRLLVATGRCVPAAFDRHTGRLLYFKPALALYHGSAWTTSGGGLYFNSKNRFQNPSQAHIGEADPSGGDGMFGYSFDSGEPEFTLNGKYRVLVSGGIIYAVGGGNIQALSLDHIRGAKRVRPQSVRWTTPQKSRVYCIAMAGQNLVTGNRGSITAFDAASGKPVWNADVDGQVRGLAVSDGRLVVSTQKGDLICFDRTPARALPARRISEAVASVSVSTRLKRTAARIARNTGKTAGCAVVIGERDCRLAEALAVQTRLRIITVLDGMGNLAAERKRLLANGLYGTRVWPHVVDDLSKLPYPPYFADLVVVSGRARRASPKECYRILRPHGGTLRLAGLRAEQREAFLKGADIPAGEISNTRDTVVRGKLPGAGEWRYPWADGGRSGIGEERRVRLPLELLWFGGPGPDRLMDRHWMGSPPVSANSRVFMQGQHHVVAFDAYNGRELWSQDLADVGRRYTQYYSSSLVADNDSVYVARVGKCHRLDQETGKVLSVYSIPGSVMEGTPEPVVFEYSDVKWPEVWQVVGPFPKGKPPLSRKDLRTVPERLQVKEKDFKAKPVRPVNGIIDFTSLYGGYGFKPLAAGEVSDPHPRKARRPQRPQAGRIAYAFARIHCPKPGKLLIGAGADWWMQWYLDGKPVYDTLKVGNAPVWRRWFSRQPCSAADHFFDVDVAEGEHVLAVMVKSGSKGWSLVSASMGGDPGKVMPVVTGDQNIPDLSKLVWGYLSLADNLVLGSYAVPITEGQPAESQLIWRSESKAVFALNKSDGSLRWVYRSKPDRTVSNIEIAHGGGRLFLLDATSKADSARARSRGEKIKAKLTLVALDLGNGTELWRQDDVPVLGDRSTRSRFKSNPSHLLMGYPTWGHLVYSDGIVVLGANAAYDAATGEKLWQKTVRPRKLPIVLGKWLISHPHAYALRTGEQRMTTDILTGQQVPWRYDHAYGCGPVQGCQNLLFFRSGVNGFFDMHAGGTTNFGGVRPNCSRSIIAAHGLLIHPEGYSGCCCAYNYQTSLALVPVPGPRETWYVFPRRASGGEIKHIAVNFGAPGDQRSPGGTAWLGFPRPMISSACVAPVSVLLENASSHYRRRANPLIKGTDAPWVYTSGLQGHGQIAVALVVQPNLVLPKQDTSPTIDGRLDDSCWKSVRAVPFENTPFTILGAGVSLRLFRDAENIYFSYHRKPIAGLKEGADGSGKADTFEIYVTHRRKRAGIRIRIQRNGEVFARLGSVGRHREVEPAWKGDWRHAVQQRPKEWMAEVAIPLKTLTDAGINIKNLQLNCMSQNLTGCGLEAIFLVDPLYGADFRRCSKFRPVVGPAAKPPRKRSFTVRLHFAEIDEVKPGQRVFDVAIQGKTVARDLDVVREAGGRNKALVKEFRGIKASDQVLIELTPQRKAGADRLDPVINGVEIIEEQ